MLLSKTFITKELSICISKKYRQQCTFFFENTVIKKIYIHVKEKEMIKEKKKVHEDAQKK